MNRKRMIIEGVLLGTLFALGLVWLVRWLNERTNQPTETNLNSFVSELAYCNDDQVKPCVVSFGVDADDNMLVNLLLPDLSFPRFYMKIQRGEEEFTYECRRVPAAPNNAYCFGEKLPPGEILHLRLISIRGDMLLAEGDLSIIGLAYPTLGVVTPTQTTTPTAEAPTATETPASGKPTPTQPSYPNTSYP